MSHWLLKAIEMLPEIQGNLESVDNPMSLWHEICWAFDDAYEAPRNDDFIKRVYQFADWCLDQERADDAENDLLTCVAVCFYEHIPTNPAARADMPRWFCREDVVGMRATFSYFLTEPEFEQLLAAFGPLQSNRKTKRQKNKQKAHRPKG